MIRGTATVAELARTAPTLRAWPRQPLHLGEVVCVQCTAEMRNSARETVLPPSLHPTVPASLSLQAWHVGESPFGAFGFAIARIGCRSGVRARGFAAKAYASTQAAADGLRDAYGLPVDVAAVQVRRHYSGAEVVVEQAGAVLLHFIGLDPEPMGNDDVQYTGTMALAQTPMGLRLVQVEADHHATHVERLTPQLRTFVPAAWGNGLLVPSRVVSSSVADERIELPPIRFVCRPEETAFTGTEPVPPAAT